MYEYLRPTNIYFEAMKPYCMEKNIFLNAFADMNNNCIK